MAVILDGEGVGEGERGLLVGRATARVTYEESATGVATSTSARAKASSRDFFARPERERRRVAQRPMHSSNVMKGGLATLSRATLILQPDITSGQSSDTDGALSSRFRSPSLSSRSSKCALRFSSNRTCHSLRISRLSLLQDKIQDFIPDKRYTSVRFAGLTCLHEQGFERG